MKKNQHAETVPWQSGFLLLDKPKGLSSFQSLRHVKNTFKPLKSGFAGTLDPDATGLMAVGIGRATKLLRFLEGMPKIYSFSALPGRTSDTYDDSGEIKIFEEGKPVDQAQLEAILIKFTGDILQQPPVYSAIKIQGKRACDRVRSGETVHLLPRRVRVHWIHLKNFQPNRWELEMKCSRGTYVRSLVHDLGVELGCGAITTNIRRHAIGNLHVDKAVPWDAVEKYCLLPPETILDWPSIHLSPGSEMRFLSGVSLKEGEYSAPDSTEEWYKIFSSRGELLAVGRIDTTGKLGAEILLAQTGKFSGERAWAG